MQKCGGCIECCFAFRVVELKKEPFIECEHAEKGKGCKIYETRPQSCRDCNCAWITQSEVAGELRPDKCGVIFERINNAIYGTIIGKISSTINGQLYAFKKQGFRVFINDSPKLHRRSN